MKPLLNNHALLVFFFVEQLGCTLSREYSVTDCKPLLEMFYINQGKTFGYIKNSRLFASKIILPTLRA
jgi:hypothetical protein